MSNVDRCGLLAEQCSRPLGRETAFWAAARLWPAPRGTRDRKDSEREGRSMRTDLRRLLGAGMGAGLALAVGLGAAGAAQAEVESKDPIKLTLPDWTGQLITTKIMGSVLQKAGRSEEHTTELQALMRNSNPVYCLT